MSSNGTLLQILARSGSPAGKSQQDSSFYCGLSLQADRGRDLPWMPSDALLRHFLQKLPAAWGLLLQFPFKCLWEVRCSWRAALQAPAPWAAAGVDGTALLRLAKLSLPCAAARLSRQPLSRSAFRQAAN